MSSTFLLTIGISLILNVYLISFVIIYKKKIMSMTGMMVSMAVGMMNGLLGGVILSITLSPNLFLSSILGMGVGITIGALIGLPISLIAVLDGFLAGLMGGMMGAMFGMMTPLEYKDSVAKIMFTLMIVIFIIVIKMLHIEVEVKRSLFNPILQSPIFTAILLVMFFLIYHQSGSVF